MHFLTGIHITIQPSLLIPSDFPTPSIMSTTPLTSLHITNAIHKWPSMPKLPQLPKLFELLQHAILTDSSWSGCLCSEKEMQDIQYKINLIIINLQCQKIYGSQFWERNPRRVQASVVHFHEYFKTFIDTIIPDDCQCLLQANRKDKLVTTLPRLEALVNNVLAHIQSIHAYMFQQKFAEEQKLTKQFFQQFIELVQILPKIKRKQLRKIPKIMEYICVVNPLQTDSLDSGESVTSIRRKNATVFEKDKQKQKVTSQQKQKKLKNSDEFVKKSNLPKDKQINAASKKYPSEFYPPKDIVKQLHLFKFRQNVRKYSVYVKKKIPTATSFQTKDKTASLQKDRSPTHDRSLTIVGVHNIKRAETLPQGREKQYTVYVERRSRQITAKSISSLENNYRNYSKHDKQETQYQREDKIKKAKTAKVKVKCLPISSLLNLYDGKRRGWGFVRQWFQQRLTQRKLRRLLIQL